MIGFTRINHIHICVSEHRLEEARLFYTNVMGLQQINRPDVFPEPGCWFAIGDIELHIGVEDPRPVTIRHSAFEVRDLDAARSELERHGITINEEPLIPGRIRFSFLDPFGNRMELMEIIDKP
jgi:catechol 2,3-dioxygenase-like lactoylglutathione lyase family enzyme